MIKRITFEIGDEKVPLGMNKKGKSESRMRHFIRYKMQVDEQVIGEQILYDPVLLGAALYHYEDFIAHTFDISKVKFIKAVRKMKGQKLTKGKKHD